MNVPFLFYASSMNHFSVTYGINPDTSIADFTEKGFIGKNMTFDEIAALFKETYTGEYCQANEMPCKNPRWITWSVDNGEYSVHFSDSLSRLDKLMVLDFFKIKVER